MAGMVVLRLYQYEPDEQYLARCPFVLRLYHPLPGFLQMGKPDNDFLIYLPVYDMWDEQPGRLLLFSIHHMAKLVLRNL